MSANTVLYYKRKAQGICVRCEGPRYGNSVLCETHLNWQRSTRKLKMPDDAPESLPCAPEPPRAPYVSDYRPVMPPIPDKCPRCSGLIVTQYGESHCLPCGWYLQPIYQQGKFDGEKYGAQLPRPVVA